MTKNSWKTELLHLYAFLQNAIILHNYNVLKIGKNIDLPTFLNYANNLQQKEMF
jgi:hypothetical protein